MKNQYKTAFWIVLILLILETCVILMTSGVYRTYRENAEEADTKLRAGLEINKQLVAKNNELAEQNKKVGKDNDDLMKVIGKYCPAGLVETIYYK